MDLLGGVLQDVLEAVEPEHDVELAEQRHILHEQREEDDHHLQLHGDRYGLPEAGRWGKVEDCLHALFVFAFKQTANSCLVAWHKLHTRERRSRQVVGLSTSGTLPRKGSRPPNRTRSHRTRSRRTRNLGTRRNVFDFK